VERRLVPDQVTPEPPAHALLDDLRSAQVSSSRQKLWEKFRLGREQLKADLLGYEGALVVFRSRMEERRMSE
jgi:hypothetical protein